VNTKIVFFLNTKSFKGKLMKAVTGCYSYHCGFLVEDSQLFYDMFWMRRRRPWAEVVDQISHDDSIFKIVDSPVEIPEPYFIDKILNGNTHYSLGDYARFGLRWFYHLFGKTTVNADGLICSEMVHCDLVEHNWHVTFKEVPSPCDLIKGLESIKCSSTLLFGKNISPEDQQTFTAMLTREVL
jgi:hypothetical protein